jgi:hypothetical protein
MLHLKYRLALLSSGAMLLLVALNAPASAAPPLPTLGPPRTPVLQIQTWRNPAFISQGMMPGSDPRTWSPYPLKPTPWNPNNAMPGSDPRTWSPYPLYPPPPSPWIPPYRPYDPPPYPAPYGPIYPAVISYSVIW